MPIETIDVGTDATPTSARPVLRQIGKSMVVAQLLALAGAAAVAALTAGSAHWSLAPLAVIAVLTVVSDLTSVETGSSKLRVSGSFLGIMLAAVLLGGGPAALVGVVSIAIGSLRWREAPHYFLNNLVAYAWFPLIGGLFFHAGITITHVGTHEIGYYLLVFAAFVVALAVNFVMVAGYQCYIDGSSLTEKTREALAPLLSAELFSALLTMAAVYVAVSLGTIGIVLFGLVLLVFQYLIGELLVSKHRSDELRRMATTDELTGLANRERFHARIEEEITAAGPANERFAVMLMDLDRFKEVNDTLGHHYGDLLLRELGPRLVECVGSDGLVARLGGDEFAVLPGARSEDPEFLEELAGRLLACVQEPFTVDELSLEVGASVGIACFPVDGRSANA
ncbi:MAG: diguanylate cyclase domain-containing protein, partial [Solirubrobacteraceae bacterium]